MKVVYDNDGRILYTVDPPYPEGLEDLYDDLASSDPDFNYLEAAQDTIVDKYVDTTSTPTFDDRPTNPTTVFSLFVTSGNDVEFDDLPSNATIYIDGVEASAPPPGGRTTDTDSIGTGDPGVYEVIVEAWPYLNAYFEITVT